MANQGKTRKEKLSIYLARNSTKPDSAIIKKENVKDSIKLVLPDAEDSVLYIKRQPPSTPPPWTQLFTKTQSINPSIFGVSSSVGSALSIRMGSATFILTFGNGFHLLNHDAIERDFGLKVTLNSVNPDKLRSLDKASYAHNPLNSRTQSTRDVDIFNLHLDSEMEMLYAITGVSEVEEFGSHVTGRDALNIAVEASLESLPSILKIAYARYKKPLPDRFRWVENINKVREFDEIEM